MPHGRHLPRSLGLVSDARVRSRGARAVRVRMGVLSRRVVDERRRLVSLRVAVVMRVAVAAVGVAVAVAVLAEDLHQDEVQEHTGCGGGGSAEAEVSAARPRGVPPPASAHRWP